MERLTLRCGRFLPRADGDADTRRSAMERYLAELSAEMEQTLDRLEQMLAELSASIEAIEASMAPAASAVAQASEMALMACAMEDEIEAEGYPVSTSEEQGQVSVTETAREEGDI